MYMPEWTRMKGWVMGAVVAFGLQLAASAGATDMSPPSGTVDAMSSTGSMHDMSMHQTMSSGAAVSSWHPYVVPTLILINQHGAPVSLNKVLAGAKPVLVQFFYASCTTICGVRSAQLVATAKKLAKTDMDIDLYMITTDPDRDTPERLLNYSQRFGVPPANWHLLTGTLAQTKQLQAAFNASDPADNRMLHQPQTFIHAGKGGQWLRIDGMTTTLELEQQIKMVVASAR
jgi:protein SCO1/2